MTNSAPRHSRTYQSLNHQQGFFYTAVDFCLHHWKTVTGVIAAAAIALIVIHFAQERSQRRAMAASWALQQALQTDAATDVDTPLTPEAQAKRADTLAAIVATYDGTTPALQARLLLAKAALQRKDAAAMRAVLEPVRIAALTPVLVQAVQEGLAASYEVDAQWDRAAQIYQSLYRDAATFDRTSALRNAVRTLRQAGNMTALDALLAETPLTTTSADRESLQTTRDDEQLWQQIAATL